MQFFGEGRVVGQFELPPSMWGEVMLGPNLLHRGDRDAGGFGHGASRPVRCFVGRRLQRHRHHALDSGPVQRCNAGRAGLVAEETVDALLHEALLPTPDRGLGLAGLRHDGGRAMAVCHQQNNPSPPDLLLGRFRVPNNRFKTLTIRGRDMNENTLAHSADFHKLNHHGIPKRTLSFRSIQ